MQTPDSATSSSNVILENRSWGFKVTEHPVTLREREQWDVDLGAIAYTAVGQLLAITSLAGTLWKIDLARSRAERIKVSASLVDTRPVATVRRVSDGSLSVFDSGLDLETLKGEFNSVSFWK